MQGVQKVLGFNDRGTRAIVPTRDRVGCDAHNKSQNLVRHDSQEPEGVGLEPLVKGVRVIMHNSRECHRLRRLCKEHKGPTYPPKCVSNIFEHLRDEMHTDVVSILGAGDGLFIGTSLIKNQSGGI